LGKDPLSVSLNPANAKTSPKLIELYDDWDSVENIGKPSSKHIKRNLKNDEIVDYIMREIWSCARLW
jgi:hypothetical protein